MLEPTKKHINLNKLNLFGYQTAKNQNRIGLGQIKFMGLYENKYIQFDQGFGMLPSIAKLINW